MPEDAVNSLWHEFLRKFKNTNNRYWNNTDDPYSLMLAIESWAEDHPEVKMSGMDDELHMGGSILLFPHHDGKKYWGTTVLVLKQQDWPYEFFLYPGAAAALERNLGYLREVGDNTNEGQL